MDKLPGHHAMRKFREEAATLVERHPLFAASLVAVAAILAADQGWEFAALVALSAGLAGWLVAGRGVALGWTGVALLAAGCFLARERSRVEDEQSLLALRTARLHGVLAKDARSSGKGWSGPVKLLDGPRPGAKVWWQGEGAPPVAGAEVNGLGTLSRVRKPRNPGEFDRADWLRRQGVSAIFRADIEPGETRTGQAAAASAAIRRNFREAVTRGVAENSPEAAVIRAVVIGETPRDADDLVAAFRDSGTLHAFSVSGLHVTMVGATAWFLLGLAGVSRRRAVLLLIPLVFGYAWITGNSPPAVRSAWMAAVFLGAFASRRRPDLLNSLGAVLLVASLWDGHLLFLPGVQLSYGVVAAIALGTAAASKAFAWMARPELYLPLTQMNRWQRGWLTLRRRFAETTAVSVVAAAGSAPLTLYHFGLVTPVSVLAGFVVIPLVYAILVVGLAGAALQVIPPAGRVVNQVNAALAELCIAAAEKSAAIPGGHYQLRPSPGPALLVFDLDQAAAMCISDAGGKAVLIDCGDRFGFEAIVAPALDRCGAVPDRVVFSQPSGERLGGGAEVWNRFPVREVLLPVEAARSPAFRAWLASPEQVGIRFAADVAEMPLPDGARLELLNLPDQSSQNVRAEERAVVFRLHWHGWKILLTADSGPETEANLLSLGIDLSADVIVSGCHSGAASPGEELLDQVRPRLLVAGDPDNPIRQRMGLAARKRWASRGLQVVDQRQAGAVTLRVDGAGDLVVEGFVDGSRQVLKRDRR